MVNEQPMVPWPGVLHPNQAELEAEKRANLLAIDPQKCGALLKHQSSLPSARHETVARGHALCKDLHHFSE